MTGARGLTSAGFRVVADASGLRRSPSATIT
jgi:hypothetical protein